ncbi:hypothetical protein ACILE2_11235 [Capnocytophaga canimorsus]|uniref:hypothetical protein n=1 Tax=Capnocytophaga canimorsus TaxID=28188 RepID=UPI0037D7ED8F
MNVTRFWQFGNGIYKGSHFVKFIFNGSNPKQVVRYPEINLVGYSDPKIFSVQGREETNTYSIVNFYDSNPNIPALKNNAIIREVSARIAIFYKKTNSPFNIQINRLEINGLEINSFEIDYEEHHTYSEPSRLYRIIFLKNENINLRDFLKKQIYITINMTVNYDNT